MTHIAKMTVAAAFALLSLEAAEASVKIEVSAPWVRANIPGSQMSAAYLSLVNSGTTSDHLRAVATPVAASAEIHSSNMEGGTMRMQRIDELELAPGKTVEFKAGGLHVMLFGIRRTLCAGERVPLTLTFAKSAPQTVEAEVQATNSGDQPAACQPAAAADAKEPKATK